VTRLHAVRVAAQLRRELNAEVEIVGGPYGQFKVDLDGKTVLEGGPLAMLGILPSCGKVIEAVRANLGEVKSP
jgi:hypothetical protein